MCTPLKPFQCQRYQLIIFPQLFTFCQLDFYKYVTLKRTQIIMQGKWGGGDELNTKTTEIIRVQSDER